MIAFTLALPCPAAWAEWPLTGRSLCEGDSCDSFRGLALDSDGLGGAIACWHQDDYPISGTNVLANRVLPSGEIAQGWSVGGRVISNAFESQHTSQVCSDGTGGYFFVWTDGRTYTNNWDVYAQRIQADGTIAPGWPVNGLPVCQEVGWQWVWSGIIPDEAGGFYVVWEDVRGDNYDVYLQRIGPDGSPAPGWPVNGLPVCTAPLTQARGWIAPDGAGGVFVTWYDERMNEDTYLHHILPDGSRAPGFPENGLFIHDHPSPEGLLPDGTGGVFIVMGRPVPPSRDYSVLRVQADGTIAPGWLRNGEPVPVTLGIVGPHINTTWTLDGMGGLYVRWDDARSDNGDQYVQHLQSNGDRVPGWPADGVYVGGGPGVQWGGQIVVDGVGGAYIVFNNSGAYWYRAYAQHINYDGTLAAGWPANGQPLAPTLAEADQIYVTVVSDSMGGAIAAWEHSALAGRRGYAMKILTDGVVAVEVSLVTAEATAERVRLEWSTAADVGTAFELERRLSTEAAWTPLVTLEPDGTGRLAYEDRAVEPGARYVYRLTFTDERGRRVTPEAWVDVPLRPAFALHGAVPNPALASDLRVRLSLAATGAARLTLHDLAGREVSRLDLAGDEPGERLVRLPSRAGLAPGIFWLVLEQGADRAAARVTVLR